MDKQTTAALRRVRRVRDFPANTCAASRHTEGLGRQLARNQPCAPLAEDTEYCGLSLLSTVASLYEARTALRTLYRVCLGMDAEVQGERPTKPEYQAAMAEAARWASKI